MKESFDNDPKILDKVQMWQIHRSVHKSVNFKPDLAKYSEVNV